MEAEMKNEAHECLTFNSPLEAGIRSVGLLVASYPKCFDIQQLVVFDYLVVHTGDINGQRVCTLKSLYDQQNCWYAEN